MSILDIKLFRDKIDTTKPGDTEESYELGPPKASWRGIRIPVKLALLLLRLRYPEVK